MMHKVRGAYAWRPLSWLRQVNTRIRGTSSRLHPDLDNRDYFVPAIGFFVHCVIIKRQPVFVESAPG